MNNYLLQILKETKTIIIPGLGALTVTNESTGEIMFMSFLKHDDGNLAKYVSEKEGIDINDAKNMIAKFVREVMTELDKGETYDMYQFGKFRKVAGEIEFEQWSSASSEAQSSETTSAQPPIEEPATEVVIETPSVVEIPVVEENPEPEPEPIAETPVVEESPKEEPAVDEPITDVVIPAVEIPVVEHHETPVIPPVEEAATPSHVQEEVKEEPTVTSSVQPPVEETPKTEEPKAEIQPEVIPVVLAEPETPKVAPKAETKKDLRKPAGKSPKEKLKEADKNKGEQPKKKKTGPLAYILWGIVVLVLGAGTYVAVQFDTLKKDFPILADLAGDNETASDTTSLRTIGETDPSAHPDSMPKAEPIPENESDVTEEVTEPEPVVEETKPVKKEVKVEKTKPAPKKTEPVVKPIPKPQPKPVTRPQTVSVYKPKPANFPTPNLSKPYHIIAGSFSSNTNARNFATKLKNMGMSNLSIGQKDGLYKVSINGYSTEEEAKAAVPSVQSIAPGAWVFKWN